jgi:hypothetical protein
MEIDDITGGDPEFPRKMLDKKSYVRVDPATGEPQLIRVEPMVSNGELIMDTVIVTIDDGPTMVMEREAADNYIASQDCCPLEITAQWKHRKVN